MKLARIFQKLFAKNSPHKGKFGSAALNTKETVTTPDAVQELDAWENGWNHATLGGGKIATLEDLEGMSYNFGYQIAYLLQEGIPEYDPDTTYYINNVVKSGSILYLSTSNNNKNNPVTDNANWVKSADLHTLAEVTSKSKMDYSLEVTTSGNELTFNLQGPGLHPPTDDNPLYLKTSFWQEFTYVKFEDTLTLTTPANATLGFQNDSTGRIYIYMFYDYDNDRYSIGVSRKLLDDSRPLDIFDVAQGVADQKDKIYGNYEATHNNNWGLVLGYVRVTRESDDSWTIHNEPVAAHNIYKSGSSGGGSAVSPILFDELIQVEGDVGEVVLDIKTVPAHMQIDKVTMTLAEGNYQHDASEANGFSIDIEKSDNTLEDAQFSVSIFDTPPEINFQNPVSAGVSSSTGVLNTTNATCEAGDFIRLKVLKTPKISQKVRIHLYVKGALL